MSESKSLLLHTCCAPCSVYCIDSLRKEEIEPTVFWYNPNIHPYIEYKTRRDCLKGYLKSIKVKGIFKENYGLDEFCKNAIKDLENRCVKYCYRARLSETVKFAKENGYEFFSTTLLVSPYQKHEELKAVCEELAELSGVKFLYRDFRVGFREGQKKARELGMYMQKYCGCIFSEEERYKKQIEKDLQSGLIEI
ncbi:epoxyqueuosine reductase QueH [Candidatus Saccharibacteria bacterium]|nr:epoxyqueuosine reductase QueH [Candidatus Saccharibacteria bacterium]